MTERRRQQRHRTLRSGKIVFHDRRSVIDCLVRNLSDGGSCLQVNTTLNIPNTFELLIDGEEESYPCQVMWMSKNRIGIEFRGLHSNKSTGDRNEDDGHSLPSPQIEPSPVESTGSQTHGAVRGELLTLFTALDEVPIGIVLLDRDSRAQFINRAFRKMWRLPDAKADSKPPFVALMYHGRDTRAYAIPSGDLDAYIATRVARVKAGDPKPIDFRLTSGETIRLQCATLPNGGRMLCYTYVTDIVRYTDELETLRGALDNIQQGIILLDPMLNAQFMNRAVRKLWQVPDEQANRKPAYVELVSETRKTGVFDVPSQQLDKFISDRIAIARAGDPTPMDIPHIDGRIIRSQCAVLPNGGRMLTYTEVTDLVHRAVQLEELAAIDCLTGLYNRRQFNTLAEAEWSRFQRYHHPLSILLIDIDFFKQINDHYGHDVGDRAIVHVAMLCREEKRATDVLGRIGGDEFMLLLPETPLMQARTLAERLLERVSQRYLHTDACAGGIPLRVSIGLAEATLSMSRVAALVKMADQALYQAKAAGRNRIIAADAPSLDGMRAAAE